MLTHAQIIAFKYTVLTTVILYERQCKKVDFFIYVYILLLHVLAQYQTAAFMFHCTENYNSCILLIKQTWGHMGSALFYTCFFIPFVNMINIYNANGQTNTLIIYSALFLTTTASQTCSEGTTTAISPLIVHKHDQICYPPADGDQCQYHSNDEYHNSTNHHYKHRAYCI